jgi:hypothetical protein
MSATSHFSGLSKDGPLWAMGASKLELYCPDGVADKLKNDAAVLTGLRLTSEGKIGGQNTYRYFW